MLKEFVVIHRMTIRENVPLAPLTTLGVGGPARYLVDVCSEEDIRGALRFAKENRAPVFVLGGGSNLVVADSGWPGLVLKIAIEGIATSKDGRSMLYDVGAGVEWDAFVAHAVADNSAGVECLSGIPGTVGGTPVQNVGAYGQDVSETIESVQAFDLKQNRTVILNSEDCGFQYRSSVFNTTERNRYIILRVTFRLTPGAPPALKYVDLQKWFSDSVSTASLAQVREAVREIRHRKGMLIVPGDEDCRSAGSFFKNPVLEEAEFHELVERARGKGFSVPSYPALDAQRKVSAAWLVEHSGFAKGFTLGAAGISKKHALALINAGQAHAVDILRLKERIQQGVKDSWGVDLEPEPVMVGF